MKNLFKQTNALYLLLTLALSACTSVTIDQVKHVPSELKEGESIVVIGRRSGNDYETEPELISCIGKTLLKGDNPMNVIPEQEFVNRLYPWFEARTAPVHVWDLQRLLSFDDIAQIIDEYNVHYIVWVDGVTEKTRGGGSISCGLSPAGVSCFGFGTWDEKAEYEASVWDYRTKKLVGKVSSIADGTSYMPAIVIPIPLLAQVQSQACSAMANQLQSFFSNSQNQAN
ncbi:hypothetical protein [Thalassomonas haliotis]|uniref:Lipoprotein n=1 Tax=Thalassomonas haliotis TaxID=485448 RepID=A0ABY7VJ50_9GAMM|nr:hypothetical protein [Thalassomonas haliotis]WDE13194.1 hypothetical protein H3N35_07065 [Thalassomonas haliotis]